MRKTLYTCQNGLYLFKSGKPFGAWEADSDSYEDGDYKLSVDEEDIIPNDNGDYNILDTKSVKIYNKKVVLVDENYDTGS